MYSKLVFLFFLLFNITLTAQSRPLSDQAEISVLTVGPGASLQDAFGHSAFRVKDPANNLDIVFGYGAYDFNAPNFYLKFAQGKLNYSISVNYFRDFLNTYKHYNRSVDEQVLNLSLGEKQQFFEYLLTNNKPENKYYLYDFFYNNCATKIKDVAQTTLNNSIEFNPIDTPKQKTFRTLIQENLSWNSWGSLGIDIALGSVIDKPATSVEYMFLPKYVHAFFNKATLKNADKNLVVRSQSLNTPATSTSKNNFLWSPLCIIGLLSGFIIVITYFDFKYDRRSKWLDVVLTLFTGCIGIAILFLWFATDHTATAQNYNLLWAFPLNIFMAGQLLKTVVKSWFKKYVKFLMLLLILMGLHWIMGVQIFALGLLPLYIALLIRYTYLIKAL